MLMCLVLAICNIRMTTADSVDKWHQALCSWDMQSSMSFSLVAHPLLSLAHWQDSQVGVRTPTVTSLLYTATLTTT